MLPSSPSVDYQELVSKLTTSCQACVQSQLPMCTKASLTKLIGASSGTIKAAWCNSAYLVIVTNQAPSWTANLDDVPTPPGGSVWSLTGRGIPHKGKTVMMQAHMMMTPHIASPKPSTSPLPRRTHYSRSMALLA